MRSLIILTLLSLCNSSLRAQTDLSNKISIEFKSGSLQQFLDVLEEKSNYKFSYSQEIIKDIFIKKISVTNRSVEKIIKPILRRNNLKIKLLGQNNLLLFQPKKSIPSVGYIYDKETGEKLAGAEILLIEQKKIIPTNKYGYFQINLIDSSEIQVNFVGYESKRIWLKKTSATISIFLESKNILENVFVFDNKKKNTISHNSLNKLSVSKKNITKIPQPFSEDDILQSLQMIPGIQTNINYPTGLSVRGGNPDQNQYLLDDIQIFNPSHLLGFVSVFNASSLQNLTLYKGGIPAEYGGNLSSVFSIQSKKGNKNNKTIEGSIGILSANIFAEGPLLKKSKKTTFSISARRSYLDLLSSLAPLFQSAKEVSESLGYYFYDVSFGIHHKLNKKNEISLNLFNYLDKGFYRSTFGQTNSSFKEERNTNLNWHGLNGGLTWNHQFKKGTFLNTVFSHSERKIDFGNYISFEFGDDNTQNSSSRYQYQSVLIQNTIKSCFDFSVLNNYIIKGGGGLVHRQFSPQNNDFFLRQANVNIFDSTYRSFESSTIQPYIFIENKIFTKSFQTNLGFRQDFFLTDSNTWEAHFQPRLSIQYSGLKNLIFNGSYSKNFQFIHQIPNNSTGIPIDLWIPASQQFSSSSLEEYSLGFLLNKPMYSYSAQAYHRSFRNILEYKNESGLYVNTNSFDAFSSGTGRSIGIELLVQKSIGDLQGWISYTLSKSDRQFDELNEGKRFFSKYHKAHNLGVFLTYPINKKWILSTNWQWISGNFISLPTIHYTLTTPSGQLPLNHLDRKNNFQLRNYNSLNISFKRTAKKVNGHSEWTFGLFNVYGYPNPMYAYFGINSQGETVLKQRTFFRFLPGIQYAFKIK